jgi:hypothetical protein
MIVLIIQLCLIVLFVPIFFFAQNTQAQFKLE